MTQSHLLHTDNREGISTLFLQTIKEKATEVSPTPLEKYLETNALKNSIGYFKLSCLYSSKREVDELMSGFLNFICTKTSLQNPNIDALVQMFNCFAENLIASAIQLDSIYTQTIKELIFNDHHETIF